MHNEKAANDLLDAVEKAIMERLPIAESFEPFRLLAYNRRIKYVVDVHNINELSAYNLILFI